MNTLIILDLSVKSLAVLLAAFAAQALWRRASASQRCLLWFVTFAALLALPLTLLIEPRWNLTPQSNTAATLAAPVAANLAVSPVREMQTASPSEKTSAQSRLTTSQMIAGVWLAGVFLVLTHRLLGSWRLRQLRARSQPCAHEPLVRRTAGLAASLGVRRRIDLRISAGLTVPVTWGISKPVVLLPQNAHEWDNGALTAALLHELAHVRQFDAATRLLATIICALHWPNPIVWRAARAWRSDQELAADDLVLRHGVAAQGYALQLLEAARSFQETGLTNAPVLAMARRATLETRLSAIMDAGRNRQTPRGRGASTVAATALVALIALASIGLHGQQPNKSLSSAAKEASAEEKANAIILPRVFFTEATVKEAMEFLRMKSRQLDSTRQGINILDPVADPAVKLNLDLHDVSLHRVLKLIGQLVRQEIRYEGNVVIFVPREAAAAPSSADSPAVAQARGIILPSVQFREATLAEAIEFLRVKSREMSDDNKGANIVMRDKPGSSAPKITLSLISVSLYDALRYTAELGGCALATEGELLIVAPR